MRLLNGFYARPTLLVAREMLGKYLIFGEKVGRIIETEAYLGPDDLASHARFKSRKRNYLMFGKPGHAYVYFTYGMYHMLNITTEEEGTAGAVLIRAVEPICGLDHKVDGPGKLTKAFNITKEHNGMALTGESFCLEDRENQKGSIVTTPRIGIDYAGAYRDKPWRFIYASSSTM